MNAPNCDKFIELIPAYHDGKLPAAEREEVRIHLECCATCREIAESLRLLSGAMEMSPLPEKLDAKRVAAITEKFRAMKAASAPKKKSFAEILQFPKPSVTIPVWFSVLARAAVFVIAPLLVIAFLAQFGGRSSRMLARIDESRFEADALHEFSAPEASTRSVELAAAVPEGAKLALEDFSDGDARRNVAAQEAKPSDNDFVAPKGEATVTASESHRFYRSTAPMRTPPPPPSPALPTKPAARPDTRDYGLVVSGPAAASVPATPPALQVAAGEPVVMTGDAKFNRSAETATRVDATVYAGVPVQALGQAAGDKAVESLGALQSQVAKSGSGTLSLNEEFNKLGEVTLAGGTLGRVEREVTQRDAAASRKQQESAPRIVGGKVAQTTTASGTLSLDEVVAVNGGALRVADPQAAANQPVSQPQGLYFDSSGFVVAEVDKKDANGRWQFAGRAVEEGGDGKDSGGAGQQREEAKKSDEYFAYTSGGVAGGNANGWFGSFGGGAGGGGGRQLAGVADGGAVVQAWDTDGDRFGNASAPQSGKPQLAQAEKRSAGGGQMPRGNAEHYKWEEPKADEQKLEVVDRLAMLGNELSDTRGVNAAGARDRETALGLGTAVTKAKKELSEVAFTDVPAERERAKKTVPLQTEYPKPAFVGTPVPLTAPNMQPPGAPGQSTRAYSLPKSTMEQFKEGDEYDGLAKHLEAQGIQTPHGSKASYDPETEKLVVTSTPQGISRFDDVVASLKNREGKSAKEVSPAADAPRPAQPRKPAGFNPYVEVAGDDAFSTFGIDVDTASYTLTRRAIEEGRLPDAEQVRTEEIVNAFDYDYAPPSRGSFAMHAQLAPSPFRAPLELLKIGVQGSLPARNQKKAAVLTMVIDTSGSMDTIDRLGRIRSALRMLAGKLQPQDSIAIVAFNTEARLLLDRTAGSDKARILAAIDSLVASGSTQLEGGMRLAYEVAARGFVSGAANRVILMSDGVANLGAATAQEILASVSQFRAQGIYLTVLGFGSGAYDDAMLMTLADKGDGMYAFVDSDEEARRLLVDQWEQTMHVIAKDVKIQVEFNPERVARWRQIGYEKRQLTKQDFRNDAVDAGEVGSGQAVTALYDIELKNAQPMLAGVLRVARAPIATVRVRYKDPDTGKVTELEQRVTDANRITDFAKAPARLRVAACASEFAELLRVSPYTAGSDFAAVIEQLRPAANELTLDQRVQELMRMAEQARALAK